MLAVLVVLIGRAAARADVLAEFTASTAAYAKQLDELAEDCQQQKLDEPATILRSWLPARGGQADAIHIERRAAIDIAARQGSMARAMAKAARPARRQTDDARREAVAEHRPSLAVQLATEAVRENPAHKQARRFLGYVKYRDTWRTPFEIRQLGAGKVWHDTFGWLPKTHVERYENGERYYQGRWMPAAEEATLRSDLKRGWRIESDHFVVTTNHSREEGVKLSRRLETLYAVWQQVFAGYLFDDAELARRFEGRAGRREPPQHNVVLYRTRDEYRAALRSSESRIDMTVGIYLESPRTAYFFAGEGHEAGTVFHEATHQLFQESKPVAAEVARQANFWAIEGIACYMESLAVHEGYCTLGGENAGRTPAARYRLLEDNFYVPLSELVEPRPDEFAERSADREALQPIGRAGRFLHACRRGALSRTAGALSGRHLHGTRHDAHAGRSDRREL